RVQDLAMRQVTGEAFQVMTARRAWERLLCLPWLFVLSIALAGETMYIESESLLAFDGRLRTGTAFLGNQGLVQGVARGMMTGQGLFTTTLEGHGELAILSEGNAIGLEVTGNTPIFVDPDAYLGHKGNLESKVVVDVNWKSFLGQTSGESFQIKFTGNGTVYIQPSER
ncbi:MAG: AIM24 family protein, partial [Chloroflexaceae bacterium]|nr:AIM24 family protein [Chloroflexaceae bacterium]